METGARRRKEPTIVIHLSTCMEHRKSGLKTALGKSFRYYLDKGFLNSSIIACASEFFPVLLVAHWLSCGGAEQRAEEVLRRRQVSLTVVKQYEHFAAKAGPTKSDARIYEGYFWRLCRPVATCGSTARNQALLFSLPTCFSWRTKVVFWVLVTLASVSAVAHWVVFFYYSIGEQASSQKEITDFDHLAERHWHTTDIVTLIFSILGTLLYAFVRRFCHENEMLLDVFVEP